MRFAIVGCGYVADFYLRTLPNHAHLELAGVFDRDAERARRFAEFYQLRRYESLEELLGDPTIQLVANLTNPASHFAVSKAALAAGKHVYSEKPLATVFCQAEELVEFAEQRGLLLASAPCNVLSETAQTLWKALREGCIGTPRLVYAELDDAISFLDYDRWVSESGAPWPYKDEFETGCTLEHAAYYLGWLTAFFGPAKRIVSFADVVLEQKRGVVDCRTPDFTVGCIEFASGPTARLTCSIYGPHDHSLRIFGDDGMLSVPDSWDYGAPVYLKRRIPVSWREKHPRRARLLGLEPPSLPLVRPATFRSYSSSAHNMDYSRGIAELADAVGQRRPSRLSARWSLHVNELVLAMSNGEAQHEMRTSFAPLAPMPWAK